MGLLCGVEFVKDRVSKTPDDAKAGSVANNLQAHGVRGRNVSNGTLAFSPPLIISEEEVDLIVKTLGAVLDAAA